MDRAAILHGRRLAGARSRSGLRRPSGCAAVLDRSDVNQDCACVAVIMISPEAPSTVTVWPVTNRVVASGTQIVAGIPYSRATVGRGPSSSRFW